MNIYPKVQAIAAFLGWKYDQLSESYGDRVSIIGPNRERIRFHNSSYRKKMMIYGSMPQYFKDFEIGVNPNREPDSIANDIKRRLLPDYLPAFKNAMEKEKQRSKVLEENQTLINTIANLYGLEGSKHLNRDSLRNWTIGEGKPGIELKFYLSSEHPIDEFSLELCRLPVDLTFKILELLKTY